MEQVETKNLCAEITLLSGSILNSKLVLTFAGTTTCFSFSNEMMIKAEERVSPEKSQGSGAKAIEYHAYEFETSKQAS